MTAQERLIAFLKKEKYPQKRLQDELGYSNGYIKNTKNFSLDRIMEISEALPDLNLHWLLTGKGNSKIGKNEDERVLELKELNNIKTDKITDLQEKIKRLEKELSKYKPNSTKPVSQ